MGLKVIWHLLPPLCLGTGIRQEGWRDGGGRQGWGRGCSSAGTSAARMEGLARDGVCPELRPALFPHRIEMLLLGAAPLSARETQSTDLPWERICSAGTAIILFDPEFT